VAGPDHVNQRSRKSVPAAPECRRNPADNFYAGFALESGQPSDSGNQTFENGFDDYNIFIARPSSGGSRTIG